MGNALFDCVIFISVFLCLPHGLGNAFTIDITPSNANGLIHDDVSMTCRLENSDGDVREIMVLELSRNDVAVALLRPGTNLRIGSGLDARFQGEGHISTAAVYDSYIHVTLSDPEVKDSGAYTCVMYFLNQAGGLAETKQSANLTVSDQDLKSAVKYLVGKVEEQTIHITDLEKNNSMLMSRLNSQDQAHSKQIQALQDKIDELVPFTNKCPQEWHLYESSDTCVKAFTQTKSFTDARQMCQDAGGDLVKVDSYHKNQFVGDLFPGGADTIWIGLWDQHHTRHWTNIDGSPLSYTHWGPGQPDDSKGLEACGHIWFKGLWNDHQCGQAFVFVCEIPVRIK